MFSKSTFCYKIRKIQILKKFTFLTKFTIYLSSSHFPNSHLRKSKLAFPIFFISDVFLAMRHFTRSLRPKAVEKSVIFPVHHGLKMKMGKKKDTCTTNLVKPLLFPNSIWAWIRCKLNAIGPPRGWFMGWIIGVERLEWCIQITCIWIFMSDWKKLMNKLKSLWCVMWFGINQLWWNPE